MTLGEEYWNALAGAAGVATFAGFTWLCRKGWTNVREGRELKKARDQMVRDGSPTGTENQPDFTLKRREDFGRHRR